MAEPAFLYVIGSRRGPHKVGVSSDPRRRLAQLQVSTHEALLLKRATETPVPDPAKVESFAHWLLRESAIRGEWFRVTEEAAWVALTAAREAVAQGLTVPRERISIFGRPRINDPDEAMTARFAAGTLARIKAVLMPKEPLAGFMRDAVEREIARRLRTPRKLSSARERTKPNLD